MFIQVNITSNLKGLINVEEIQQVVERTKGSGTLIVMKDKSGIECVDRFTEVYQKILRSTL